jgi:hypothetical protein
MAERKRRAEVISLVDSDEVEDELTASRRRTRQRREERRAGSSSTAPAEAGSSFPTSSSGDHWTRPRSAITCPICFCEEEPASACKLASCGHAFCVECLSTYVKGKVEQGEVMSEQLVCPCVEPSRCGVPLVPQDVRRCLGSAAAADRYERLTLQRFIETEEDTGSCPTPGCPFVFAWEANNRKLECPLCAKSYCLVCRTEPWHSGVRCEAFQRQHAAESGDVDAADAAFEQFASRQKLRACPKCKFWVEKTSGCDAMHCRCNLVFCYQCGGVLRGGQARKTLGLRECACGPQHDAVLRAHEGQPNHNLLAQQPQMPPAAMRGGAAYAAFMDQMAVFGLLPRNPFG